MPRIVLYTKPDCSLCDDARAALDAIGRPYEIAEDARYASRVPVIEVDGVIVAELRVTERTLRRAVKRASRRAKSSG
ncbi:MAG TPA: glutaredoxin family protein [Actinomycetota bacterium]